MKGVKLQQQVRGREEERMKQETNAPLAFKGHGRDVKPKRIN